MIACFMNPSYASGWSRNVGRAHSHRDVHRPEYFRHSSNAAKNFVPLSKFDLALTSDNNQAATPNCFKGVGQWLLSQDH